MKPVRELTPLQLETLTAMVYMNKSGNVPRTARQVQERVSRIKRRPADRNEYFKCLVYLQCDGYLAAMPGWNNPRAWTVTGAGAATESELWAIITEKTEFDREAKRYYSDGEQVTA